MKLNPNILAGCILLLSLAITVIPASAAPHWPSVEQIRNVVDETFFDLANGPGCAVGIQHEGNTIFTKGFGYTDVESKDPITDTTLFNIASMSKQFTVLAILKLQSQGLLSVNDPVKKFIPEITESHSSIQISDLIHHTSGLMDYLGYFWFAGIRDFSQLSRETALHAMFGESIQVSATGRHWAYNNGGYLLLAEIVTRVSGQNFENFARKNVLLPFAMDNSYFRSLDDPDLGPIAHGYVQTPNGLIEQTDTVNYSGDGGLITNIQQFLKYTAAMHSNRGLWNKKNAEFITTPAKLDGPEMFSETGTLDTTYGGGLGLQQLNGHLAYTHTGGIAGYNSNFAYFPDNGLAIVAFCNLRHANLKQRFEKVYELYFNQTTSKTKNSEQSRPPENQEQLAPALLLTSLEGQYSSEQLRTIYEFKVNEKGGVILSISSPFIPKPLVQEFSKILLTADGLIALTPSFIRVRVMLTESGKVKTFKLVSPITPAFEFQRITHHK
ncbi:MAG: serine hydrolase domain-containing protein [Paraglaciecola sp.]|uniref:serine hydrolase domain-containing protein n=1 Tax=Paraglaciecola sp. TaxID=1920173 RepID=UPI00329858A7